MAQPESGQRTVPSAVTPPRPVAAPSPPPVASGVGCVNPDCQCRQRQSEPEGFVNRFELQIVASIDVVKAEPNEDEESP